ncbi:MAG: hypothetical protein ACC742_16395 [Thermoanaerobaculales bacterium]
MQVGRRLDLGQEALGTDHPRQLGLEDLDGDLAVVLQVFREVDGGHAARTDLLVDGIAILES